ncbi:MAG: hypothetical protein ACMUIA_10275 [bacterium]
MDKIIFFIILLYVFSRLSRILKGEEGGKRRQYPPPHVPRQPHPRPPAQPPPGGGGRPGQETRPSPVSRREEDALQILAEWERKAQRQKAGRTEVPSEWEREIQRQKPGEWEREIQGRKAGQIEVPSEMGEEPLHHPPASESLPRAEHLASIGYPEVEHTGEEPGDVRSRGAEKEDILHLHHPSVLREGIILSEILRPAIVLRPFAPPYRR